MSQTLPDARLRPLLFGGERLAVPVERVSGGGGDKYHPQTLTQARQLLAPMTRSLVSDAQELPQEVRSESVVFQATLLPNYLANSYFPSALLEFVGLRSLGSRRVESVLQTRTATRDAVTKSLILAGSDTALIRLAALVESENEGSRSASNAAQLLRQFSDVRFAQSHEVIKVPFVAPAEISEEPALFEAVLHPNPEGAGPLRPLQEALLERWVEWVRRAGGEVLRDLIQRVGGLTFVPVSVQASMIPQIAAFNLLRAIRPMPQLTPFPEAFDTGLLRGLGRALPPPAHAIRPTSLVRVAVVDGGVDDASVYFSPFVEERDLTGQPQAAGSVSHGSAVTAACLYGDLSSTSATLMPAPASISHFRMSPHRPGDPDAVWLLDHIKTFVNDEDFALVNLSLGPQISVEDDNEPHTWTCTLDRLAYETDTLFVVAAGNNGARDPATGLNRVQVPADMVNGLSVGAADLGDPETPWSRASYSAVGPGRAGARIQPGGLSFGGTDTNPFAALQGDGRLLASKGTSFATPLVTNGLINLAATLGPSLVDAATLRAFAAHGAVPHSIAPDEVEHGHGRFPTRYDDLLLCGADEATVLYQGVIERDEVIALRLPVPVGLGKGNVQLQWTLAVTAPTEPTEALEYTRGALEVRFRPHADRFSYRRTGRKTVILNNLSQSEEVAAMLADGYAPSTHPAPESATAIQGNEAERRESGKWETLRKFGVRKRTTSVHLPRIDLSHIARQGGMLDRSVPPLRYAMVATVRGPRGSDLYDQVRSQLTALTQLGAPITAQVRNQSRF